MKASEFCNREVVIVEREASVLDAAQLMRTHHVGSVVVVVSEGEQIRPVGVLTDRDIVLEFVAKEVSTTGVAVADAMSFELVTISEDTGLFEAIETMRSRGVRRVPVVNADGHLVGLFASDDALELLAEQLSDLVAVVVQQRREESSRRD